jgi:bacillolysin
MHFKTRFSFLTYLIVLVSFYAVLAMDGSFKISGNLQQKPAASALSSDTLDTLIIKFDAEGKRPIFISGKIVGNSQILPSLKKAGTAAQKRALCQSYLSKISHVLKIARPSEELTIIDQADNTVPQTAHYKIKQMFRGIPVLGAEGTVHIHDDQAEFIGHTIATPNLTIVPAFNSGQAIGCAISDLGKTGVVVRDLTGDEKEFLDYSGPSAKLIVFPSSQAGANIRLAYQVLVRPDMIEWWEYIVDAETGEILQKINRTCDAGDATTNVNDLSGKQRLIHTYQTDKYYLIDASRPMFVAWQSQIPNNLVGAIVTYDYQNKYPATSSFNLISSTNNSWWDPKAVSAQYNASVAYEYYRTTHNRNSINGKGGSIRSFINVADQYGAGLDNAYWNGVGMYYGSGNRVFNPLAGALDVAGHELTHGVIEATAALRYIGQSGALSESFADIFGCMIERINWKMGETIIKPGIYPSNALRDLSNPHNGSTRGKSGWQPQNMMEYQVLPNTTSGDNGGVHINSGIPSYAYYLFATAIGKEKAERVFYRTLTTYLSASSQFADLRIGSNLACEELYGKGSTEDSALAKAFDSVGLFDNSKPVDPVADLPVNPGKEYVLVTAAPTASDGTTLYLADSAFGSLKSISKRPVKFRPSVSDDGKKIIFVSGDKQLIALTLNGTYASERVLDTAKVWSICAISRDGQHFAAVHEKQDTAIYIGSMGGGPMRKFNLNGPANDSTRAVSGAVFSSALEWNFTGDNVIYDVYNSFSGPNNTTLRNCDIGFLRSWDLGLNTFGDGEVSKLFSNLPEGISVGNPTFSKNSPNIIAYESIDTLSYSTSVMTMNMENRKIVTVAQPRFTGYPSYSKRDDKIAFSTIDGTDTVVSVVKLKSDKQTPDGTSAIAIRKMKWAVYFAQGSRQITPVQQPVVLRSTPSTKLDLKILSCKGGLKAMISGAGQTMVHISITRADGKIIHRETVFAGKESAPYTWNGRTGTGISLGQGIYFLRMQTPQGTVAKKLFFN